MKRTITFLAVLLLLIGYSKAHAAVITVNTNQDQFGTGAECSLREAIECINRQMDFGGCVANGAYTFSKDDRIEFQNPNQVFSLTLEGAPIPLNSTGDLDICNPMTLQGGGAGVTIIRAAFPNVPDRVVHVWREFAQCAAINAGGSDTSGQGAPSEVVFDGITIENGDAPLQGGIIAGGGIFNEALLLVSNSVVQNNNADNLGPNEGPFEVFGGGIFNFNVVSLVASDVRGNTAVSGGGAAAPVFAQGGGIATAQILGNGGSAVGGQGLSCLTSVDTSNINRNTVTNGRGGGIYNDECPLLINMSAIFENQVTGMENVGTPGLGSGGGLFNILSGTTVPLGIVDSTISGNSAVANGGGHFDITQEGVVFVSSSTIANNTADSNGDGNGNGGGWYRPEFSSQDRFLFQNTIVSDNFANSGPDCFSDPNTMPNYQSFGYNLVRDQSNCVINGPGTANDQPAGTDPMLVALANNGGRTPTMALPAGSPAIDMGNDVAGCTQAPNNPTVIQFDQRDDPFDRTIAGVIGGTPRCDIGAYEFEPTEITTEKTAPATVNVGDSFTYVITITNNGPGIATGVTINDPLPAEVTFVSFGNISQGTCNEAAGVITCDIGVLMAGAAATVEVNVVAMVTGTATNTATVTTNETEPQNPTAVTEIVGAFCITGSGKFWTDIRPGCANCGLNPYAFSVGFWKDWGAYLGLALMLLVAAGIRRRTARHFK